MVRYILQQIKITSHKCYGKWFAKNVVEETFDLDALAEHMSNHNSPYSKGVIKGLLTDMISCIKELLLEGKNVKIDDLAIFSLGIKNKVMADTEEDFTVSKNISGVKLKARATGELMSKSLNLEATLKKATYVNGKLTSTDNSGSSSGSGNGSGSESGSEGQGGSQSGNEGGSQSGNEGSSQSEQPQATTFTLTISKTGTGTATVTKDGNAVASGASLSEDDELVISITPAEDQVPTATLNGSSIELTENDGVYSGNFAMPGQASTLVINTGESDDYDPNA